MPLTSTLHPSDAGIPAGDHRAPTKPKHQRFAAMVCRAIKLPPVPISHRRVIQIAGVLNRHNIATAHRRPMTYGHVSHLQTRREAGWWA